MPTTRLAHISMENGTDPTPTGTEARVCRDIASRQVFGLQKYGTTVELNSQPKQFWQRSLYEELLDAAIYLRRLMDDVEKETGLCKKCRDEIACSGLDADGKP